MRMMTGSALPFAIRSMGIFELFGQIGVAGKTGFCRPRIEKIRLIRRMRVMTGKAFPFPNRSMHDRLLQILDQVRVTGIAQLGNLALQHAGVAGHVRIVAGAAIPLCNRVMLHPLLEIGTVVTGETVYGCQGRDRSEQQQSHQTGQANVKRDT
jgi:hypothetical protein